MATPPPADAPELPPAAHALELPPAAHAAESLSAATSTSRGSTLPALPSLPLELIVAASDAASAARTKELLRGQRWTQHRVVHPVAKAVAESRKSGSLLVLLQDGLRLAPMALECAWWALETQGALEFVALGDERGKKTPMLDATAACVALRPSAIAENGPDDPARLALASVFAALKKNRRGQLIREPLTMRPSAPGAVGMQISQMLTQLRAQGMSDAGVGDTGYDLPPPELPMQAIDERPLPSIAPVLPPLPATAPVLPPLPAIAPVLMPLPTIAPALMPLPHGAPSLGKSLRVLALLQGFPRGGYAAFNADFLPRLARNGHALTVCATEMWRTDWQLERVREVTDDVVFAPGVVALPSVPRLVSHLIESRRIDVVLLSHAFNAARMLPWLRLRHPRCAFVDYVHTDWFETTMYGSYATLSAATTPWLDAQVASSQMLARELVRRGARESTARAITINLDVADWDPARFPRADTRAALGCKPGQPLVLFAGRASSEKRPLLAVACWKALTDASRAGRPGFDARFAVAGTGPLLNEMMKAVADAGLKSRVAFLGELDGEALRYVFAAADVLHAPSEIEGISRSLYEAMAMECVPVVADVGGQGELVDAGCGFLVAHGPDEVRRYVEALAAAGSESLRAALGKAARARIANHFTAGQCVAAFENVFAEAVERRRAEAAKMNSADSPNDRESALARELALSGLEISRRHFWQAALTQRAARAEAALTARSP